MIFHTNSRYGCHGGVAFVVLCAAWVVLGCSSSAFGMNFDYEKEHKNLKETVKQHKKEQLEYQKQVGIEMQTLATKKDLEEQQLQTSQKLDLLATKEDLNHKFNGLEQRLMNIEPSEEKSDINERLTVLEKQLSKKKKKRTSKEGNDGEELFGFTDNEDINDPLIQKSVNHQPKKKSKKSKCSVWCGHEYAGGCCSRRDLVLGVLFTVLGGAALVYPTNYVVGKIQDALLPDITISNPTHVQQTTGIFSGNVTPKSYHNLKYYFEYKTTDQTHPSVTPLTEVPAGGGLVQYQFDGLLAYTNYEVRLVLRFTDGSEQRGPRSTFSTKQFPGSLVQLKDQEGCVSSSGSDGCATAHSVENPESVVLSPDGKFVYTASFSGGFGVFSRNSNSGVLTQLPGQQGCVSETDSKNCATGHGIEKPQSVVLSPDGKFVYTASFSGGFGVFSRDSNSGVLTQLPGKQGCVSDGGSDGCATALGVDSPQSVALSPDGKFVYTASRDGGFGVFSRDSNSGVLTQLPGQQGCVDSVGPTGPNNCAKGNGIETPFSLVVSPDANGAFIYTASNDGGFGVFSRDSNSGVLTQLSGQQGCVDSVGPTGPDKCTLGRGVEDPLSMTVSADGEFVYTASWSGGFGIFSRDSNSGVLTQLSGQQGCVSVGGSEDCAIGRGVESPHWVAVSPDPDGKFVYTASETGGFNVFARDQQTGVLTQLSGQSGCVNESGADGCATARGVGTPHSVVLSSDGQFAYTASFGGGFGVFAPDQQTGVLTQLSGQSGCVNEFGSEGCATARGVESPRSLVVSSDGKFAYTASNNGGFGAFSRDTTTGVVTQLSGQQGCIIHEKASNSEGCALGRGIKGPVSVAMSADGKSVYTASFYEGFGVFSRDPDSGVLTQLQGSQGCVDSVGPTGPNNCAKGYGVKDPYSIVVSGDGKFVYTASYDDELGGFGVFSRDSSSGVLTQLQGSQGCVDSVGPTGQDKCTLGRGLKTARSVVLSPDGKFVYTASWDGGFGVFSVQSDGSLQQLTGQSGCVNESGSEGCATARSVETPRSVLVSPDGYFVYTASRDGGFGVFSRDPTTGVVTQLSGLNGCVNSSGSEGCAKGLGVEGPALVALSGDKKFIYTTSVSGSVAVFARDLGDGSLMQLEGAAGCIVNGGGAGCAKGRSLAGPEALTISPDNNFVYTAAEGGGFDVFSRSTG